MLAEGVRLAEEALAEGVRVREAVVSDRLLRDERGRSLGDALRRAGVTTWRAADELLDWLHDAQSHQGILMIVERPSLAAPEFIALASRTATGTDAARAGPPALVLVACGVQDPGNMGALVRLTDAAGGSGLLAAGGADPFGPKAVRASAGSIFRLPVARTEDLSAALGIAAALRERGLLLAAAVPKEGTDYRAADLSRPLALFVGGEGWGLPPEAIARLDMRLSIPMSPRVESINVAGAAAVLLFEAAARRGVTTPRGSSRPPARVDRQAPEPPASREAPARRHPGRRHRRS
jgi:RNA methyltransferase, TrmH family